MCIEYSFSVLSSSLFLIISLLMSYFLLFIFFFLILGLSLFLSSSLSLSFPLSLFLQIFLSSFSFIWNSVTCSSSEAPMTDKKVVWIPPTPPSHSHSLSLTISRPFTHTHAHFTFLWFSHILSHYLFLNQANEWELGVWVHHWFSSQWEGVGGPAQPFIIPSLEG